MIEPENETWLMKWREREKLMEIFHVDVNLQLCSIYIAQTYLKYVT